MCLDLCSESVGSRDSRLYTSAWDAPFFKLGKSVCLYTMHTVKGLVEANINGWFTVFLWWEVCSHVLDHHHKFLSKIFSRAVYSGTVRYFPHFPRSSHSKLSDSFSEFSRKLLPLFSYLLSCLSFWLCISPDSFSRDKIPLHCIPLGLWGSFLLKSLSWDLLIGDRKSSQLSIFCSAFLSYVVCFLLNFIISDKISDLGPCCHVRENYQSSHTEN